MQRRYSLAIDFVILQLGMDNVPVTSAKWDTTSNGDSRQYSISVIIISSHLAATHFATNSLTPFPMLSPNFVPSLDSYLNSSQPVLSSC